MNFGRVAAGGARARVLAEEDDEEGAHGERRCGRAARNHIARGAPPGQIPRHPIEAPVPIVLDYQASAILP